MTTEEIRKILKLHKAWINGEKHGKRANMSGAENVPYTPMECPDEGEFTGWKNAETIES